MASNVRGVRTPAPGGTYIGRPAGAGMGAMSIQPSYNPYLPKFIQAGSGIQIEGGVITVLPPSITFLGDATGSGTSPITLTLATVNADLGTYASVDVNAKGLVVAAAALSGDATTAGSVITLATVNSDTGTINGVTTNGKGLVTANVNQGYWVADTDWSFSSHILTGTLNGTALPSLHSGITPVLRLAQADAVDTDLVLQSWGSIPSVWFIQAHGTAASPTATQSGDFLGGLHFTGYTTAYSASQAGMFGVAAENWSSSAAGNYLSFYTTPVTTLTQTEQMRLTKGLTLPSGVTGGDEGAGTINVSTGYYLAGGNVLTQKATLEQVTSAPGSVTATSPTYKMLGLAGAITPVANPKVFITITGSVTDATLGDTITLIISRGTGTGPANGAGLAGAQEGAVYTFTQAVASDATGFSLSALVNPGAVGLARWIDLAVGSSGGHAITFGSTCISAFEI